MSDLHFGLGRRADGWSSHEDFRWPETLAALLSQVEGWGQGQIDLVIAGDLLELWQHPAVDCSTGWPDFACTVQEAADLVRSIASAHAAEISSLAEFARRGSNRLVVLPGNHDAALLLDPVWLELSQALALPPERLLRGIAGRWISPQALLAVEHGHQVGADVNRFRGWPVVTARGPDGRERLIRSWGENFVDTLFTPIEADFPLIDNLQPMGAGVKYRRLADADATVLRDAARFLAFAITKTSLRQTIALGDAADEPSWNVASARNRGHRLFGDAMAGDDPTRPLLLTSNDAPWPALRTALDSLAGSVLETPDDEVRELCDRAQVAAARPASPARSTCQRTLGLAIGRRLLPENRVLKPYLKTLPRSVKLFVYGHTHHASAPRELRVSVGRRMSVANSGAFQRLIDEPQFLLRAEGEGISPTTALSRLPLESIGGCFPALFVEEHESRASAELRYLLAGPRGENPELVGACDERCVERNDSACRSFPPPRSAPTIRPIAVGANR